MKPVANLEFWMEGFTYSEPIIQKLFSYLFNPLQRCGQKLSKAHILLFGRIEAKKKCLWDFLTFNKIHQPNT